MRLIEVAIPILLGAYLLWPRPQPLLIRLTPALAGVATLLHFYIEGYRWQMLPLYLLTLALTVISLKRSTNTNQGRRVATYLTLLLVLVSTLIPILLPIPHIPTPSGSYQVGTRSFEMTDVSRAELYSGQSNDPRHFMIQVWYPATANSSDIQALEFAHADIYTPVISELIGMPSFFLDHLALAKTPAYESARLAETADLFPVVIFSHGWKGYSASNTSQAIELASNGFVVVAMQHTYGALVTVFPDGTVVANNPNALPADENDPGYEIAVRKLAAQWAGDISFVLDQLEDSAGEAGKFFSRKIDLDQIGVYGHSTGGGAAIQFCGTDPRCIAVLGMDPWMRPVSANVIASGVSQPSFFMFSQEWAEIVGNANKNNELFGDFYANNSSNHGAIEILGTKHLDFSDLPLLSPIAPLLGLKGPLNGSRVTEIVNSYLIDFFEMTLMNKPSPLFAGDFADYEEVKTFR